MDDDEHAAEDDARSTDEVDGLALAAFVFSLVSLVVPVVMTGVAVVLARKASRRIETAHDGRRGRQLSVAAQVVSLTWFGFLLATVVTIAAFAAIVDDGEEGRRAIDVDRTPSELEASALLRSRILDRYVARDVMPEPLVTVADRLTYTGDLRPGPLRFDDDAVLTYSTTGSYVVITIVGDDGRAVIARCDDSCDGRVELGRFQSSDFYELEIDTDGAWYLAIDGGHEVVD